MFFTTSGSAKLDKELIRKVTRKAGKCVSFLPKTIKYSATKTEEQLHVLGQALEQEGQPSVKLILMLHDKEGKTEGAGIEHVFSPLDYQISEGFYPTLIDLIRLDVLEGTGETVGVEKSYRSEEFLRALEEKLESNQRKVSQMSKVEVSEEVPWE